MVNDLCDTFGYRLLVSVDSNLRFFRRFVWRTYAGKICNLAGPRFFVETFRVALFANLNWRVDVDFEKIAFVAGRTSAGQTLTRPSTMRAHFDGRSLWRPMMKPLESAGRSLIKFTSPPPMETSQRLLASKKS